MQSVTDLWPTADYQEREVYDLMGVSFVGHPNLTRIFLSLFDGCFTEHPLRKEYRLDKQVSV